MTTMPPPVFTQPDSAVVQRSGTRKDSEADDWDSFVASSTGFNPSQLHKRELGHRLDEFQRGKGSSSNVLKWDLFGIYRLVIGL